MFRSPKIDVQTLSYKPDLIHVMETGKKDGISEIEDFRRRIKENRNINYKAPWYKFW